MKKVWALLLCVLMVLGATACSNKQEQQEGIPISRPSTSDTTLPETDTTDEEKIQYTHNAVINRFFEQYVALYGVGDINPDTIRRGKDTSVYTVQINECEVTIMDVTGKSYPSGVKYDLQFSIVNGTSNKAVDKMLSAFAKVARAADPACTQEIVENVVDHLGGMKQSLTNTTTVGERVHVMHFSPVITNDFATLPCRMDWRIVVDPTAETTTTAAE